MASHSMIIIVFSLLTLSSFNLLAVTSFDFQVGGTNGWKVPPPNDSKIYNDWASENRFQVGDAIHFKYKKDSVLAVTDTDYKKCNSTHPSFFSNTGNTVFKLNRTGLFYFISGASGHCQRGQRMIVKVMSHEDSAGGGSSSSASKKAAVLSYGVVGSFVLSCLFYP